MQERNNLFSFVILCLCLSEVCFNLFLCGSEKFKNYEEFCETDTTSEKLDKVTGKNL